MKIAMIGHKKVPSREGGVEIVVEELSTRMEKKNHTVDVYNRAKFHELKNTKKTYNGINLKNAWTMDIKGSDAIIYSITATLRAIFHNYDIIHYHAEGPCAMIWLPHFLKKRTIATIHGLDWQRSKWGGLATKYIKFGEKMAAKYADEIIVLSKSVQQYFKDEYNRDAIYIPNAVNKPKVKEGNIIKKSFALEKQNYILYLARIVPEKGLHYLIEAYKGLGTDKKLVIAGDISQNTDYIKEVRELAKGNDNILFTGFAQGEILEELFSNAYVYVLPSDLEGMPISMMEAMSYGTCCLSSDIEECTQIVDSKSFSFKKGDIESLRQSLEYLLSNEDVVIKNGLECKKRLFEKYDWDVVIDQTLSLYKEEMRIKENDKVL
ncbi:glycosyltransferase family 4 protein [Intestinibacter sp.]